MTCPAFLPGEAFLTRALWTVDCYAQSLGENGYRTLAAPGSATSLVLTSVLTIFVALFGYRLLFGDPPDVREGVVAAAKIGVALALATSWPAFRTLVYDVTLRAPAQLASTVGRPSGIPGTEGALIARLQGVDTLLAELMIIGTGRPPWAEANVAPTGVLTPAQQQQELARLQRLQDRPPWIPARDARLVGQARTLFLVSAIGGFAAVRLLAGLLLALGPLFALFLLFDRTRGLFEGWIRGLAGAALGMFAVGILLGIELAMLEPWLAALVTGRRAGLAAPEAPLELLVATASFSIALLASLAGVAKVASGLRFPFSRRVHRQAGRRSDRFADAPTATPPQRQAAEALDMRSRAVSVADAMVAAQRRDSAAVPPQAMQLGTRLVETQGARSARATAAAIAPLTPDGRRRTRGRVSGAADQRDRRR